MTQAMKFRIKDEEHSKAIQEKLFSIGCSWGDIGFNVQNTDKVALYVWDDKKILYSSADSYNSEHFADSSEAEYILLDGQLVPADSVAEAVAEVVTEGAVKSDGGSSSYYELTITNKAGECIAIETGDILRALVGNDFDLSNIVKACRRAYEASQGRGKQGASIAYDMKKVEYFAQEFAHWHKD